MGDLLLWAVVEQACVGEENEGDCDKAGEHKNINEEEENWNEEEELLWLGNLSFLK